MQKQNDIAVTNVSHVIHACCVLHNICEIRAEGFAESWLYENNDLQQPTTGGSTRPAAHACREAKKIRDAPVDYLMYSGYIV